MAVIRTRPNLIADAAAEFGSWTVDSGQGFELLQPYPTWDYATPLTFQSSVRIDRSHLAEAGLDIDAPLTFLITAECPDTYFRVAESVSVFESTVLSLELPPGSVAKEVVLERRVVVEQSPGEADAVTPRRGQVVAGTTDRTLVRLEGVGGQFPMEALSFRTTGRPDAPWQLNLTYDSPTDNFVGSLQLLLNLDNDAVAALVSATAPSGDLAEKAASLLGWDLSRQLVQRAISDDRLDRRSWPEGSVGAGLERICVMAGLGRVAQARNLARVDPDLFEAKLKAGLGVLA